MVGFGPNWRGVGLQHTRGLLVPRLTVGFESNGPAASSIAALLAPAAQTSAGETACSCLQWPAMLPMRPHRPHTTPTAGHAIPLLTLTPCYSAATAASHRSRTSEPSYSSPCGLPLLRLPWLCIVPFLGLAIVHRPGALGAAWSTWSTTDFHRKSSVRREANSWVQAAARKCLLITRKIIIPPPDSRDPPDGPPYFAKKKIPP